jgi:tetratricopeptide (TPR) repeat protein
MAFSKGLLYVFHRRLAMKRGVLVVLSLAVCASVHAKNPSGYVVPQGVEDIFIEMAKIGSYTVAGIRIEFNKVLITYEDGKNRIELALVHPSSSESPLFRTSKFAVVSANGMPPPEPLLRALKERIVSLEHKFEWGIAKEPQKEAEGNLTLPILGQSRDPSAPIMLGLSSVGKSPVLPHVAVPKELQDLAENARSESDPGKLKKIAKELSSAKEGGAGAKRLAAFVLRRAKDFRGALSLLDEAVKEESKTKNRVDPMLLIERLACLLATENEPLVREALAMMQSAYRFDPDCVEAEGVDLLVREGLKDVAMKVSKGVREGNKLCQMRVAMRVYGANQDGSGVLSVVSRLLGDKKTVSDIKSQELDLLFGCAEYFSAAKDYNAAVRCADILVKRDPSYPNAMDFLGSLYIGAGFLTRKSLEAMIVLAKERKDDLVASYLAGLGLYYASRHRECIPFLEPVVKEFPNESRPAMYLAMAYFFSGDRKKALDILEGLEPFAKKNIDIYYCRSLVYREFDRQRSIEELEKFVTASAEEDRFSFSELKLRKAKSDLEALKRGETLAPVPPSDFYILWE